MLAIPLYGQDRIPARPALGGNDGGMNRAWQVAVLTSEPVMRHCTLYSRGSNGYHQLMIAKLMSLLLALAAPNTQAQDPFESQRKRMLQEIAAMLGDGRDILGAGQKALSPAVMAAMARVPRHEFVPEARRREAYDNRPLPIAAGQTISQPFIVALMSELMRVKPGDRVLEIGTGSGYQAAVLAELGATVFTVEIVEPLAREAATLLTRLGYRQIRTRIGDGYLGWPEEAPFDAIMLTAAPREVPQPLIDQLKPGGRLVVPVGEVKSVQSLLLIEKRADGSLSRRTVLAVRFVPLTEPSGKQR